MHLYLMPIKCMIMASSIYTHVLFIRISTDALHPDVRSAASLGAGWHGSVQRLAERPIIFSAFQGSFHQLQVHKRSDQSSTQLASRTTGREVHRLAG